MASGSPCESSIRTATAPVAARQPMDRNAMIAGRIISILCHRRRERRSARRPLDETGCKDRVRRWVIEMLDPVQELLDSELAHLVNGLQQRGHADVLADLDVGESDDW